MSNTLIKCIFPPEYLLIFLSNPLHLLYFILFFYYINWHLPNFFTLCLYFLYPYIYIITHSLDLPPRALALSFLHLSSLNHVKLNKTIENNGTLNIKSLIHIYKRHCMFLGFTLLQRKLNRFQRNLAYILVSLTVQILWLDIFNIGFSKILKMSRPFLCKPLH